MQQNSLERFMRDIQAAQEAADAGKTDDAEFMLRAAAKRFPRGWVALANEYLTVEDYQTAEKLLRQSLELTEDKEVLACCYSNLGLIASKSHKRKEAQDLFEKAISHDDSSASVLNNIALAKFWEGDTPGAMTLFERALEADPFFADAEFHLSMCLIKIGDWNEGWRKYESRWRKQPAKLHKLETNKPEWDGQTVNHILVVGEQGCGDTIMTARLAEPLFKYCKRQTWITQKGVSSLIETVPGVEAREELDFHDFDAHVPSMTLFHRLGITHETLPTAPYIPKPPAPDLGPGRHVGIVWRGSSEHNHNVWRSSQIDAWGAFAGLEGWTVHSLQYDGLEDASDVPWLKHRDQPKDWLETAARMAGMDLVVSVDTGAAHLAGAMGVPLWLLLSPSAEWRWGCDAEKTVLYPSARLFRMDKEMDWENTLNKVAKELKRL